ncbi:MAG: hypothetical protein HXX15_08865 [Rhodopseudomonas sp.]|uniref:hypothetical protein n=1 Tax=Rhodopseudomonas sp. TaxID=1078 RepID=UPI0017D89356|nr:hypothetical protein [Rhodopseudomonas sp.]NVN86188.1 hypothetical protein [Rhodopseudomonas sp.]
MTLILARVCFTAACLISDLAKPPIAPSATGAAELSVLGINNVKAVVAANMNWTIDRRFMTAP